MSSDLSPDLLEDFVVFRALEEDSVDSKANDVGSLPCCRLNSPQSIRCDCRLEENGVKVIRIKMLRKPHIGPDEYFLCDIRAHARPGILRRTWRGVSYIGSSLYSHVHGLFAWIGLGSSTTSCEGNFRTYLTRSYPGLIFPDFSPLPLYAAMGEARLSERPLLVYLHNPMAAEGYIREVIASPQVVAMINNGYLPWGQLKTSTEAQELMRTFGYDGASLIGVCKVGMTDNPEFELLVSR